MNGDYFWTQREEPFWRNLIAKSNFLCSLAFFRNCFAIGVGLSNEIRPQWHTHYDYGDMEGIYAYPNTTFHKYDKTSDGIETTHIWRNSVNEWMRNFFASYEREILAVRMTFDFDFFCDVLALEAARTFEYSDLPRIPYESLTHGTDLHHLSTHDVREKLNLWKLDACRLFALDLHPQTVEWTRAVLLSWITAILIVGTGIAISHAKYQFMKWLKHRPGICRYCKGRRLAKPYIRGHGKRIGQMLFFVYLAISANAIDSAIHSQRESLATPRAHSDPLSGIRYVFDVGKSTMQQHGIAVTSNSDFCARSDTFFRTTAIRALDQCAADATPGSDNHDQADDWGYAVESTEYEDEIEPDGKSLMQIARNEVCGTHLEPTLYWDRLSFRPPIINSRFYVWRTNTVRVNQLQNQLLSVAWDGTSCIKCAYLAAHGNVDGPLLRGPYYIRPQPAPIDGIPVLHFLALTLPKLDIQKALHVGTHSASGHAQGTVVINTITGILASPTFFDIIMPNNRCRTIAWCRIRWQDQNRLRIWWWPATFSVPDFAHVDADEFEITQSTMASRLPAPTQPQSHICQSSPPDIGSTTYDQDDHSLFAFHPKKGLTHDDHHEIETISLMHISQQQMARSRSHSPGSDDTSQVSGVSSSDSASVLVVYGRYIEPQLIPTNSETPIDLYKLVLAHHFEIPFATDEWHGLSTHFVRPKPQDLAQAVTPVIVVFFGQHRIDQAHALIDISLHTNRIDECGVKEEPNVFRETWTLPISLTSHALIHGLGIRELCQQIAFPCLVSLGDHAWRQQDATPHTILDGIFIRIEIQIASPELPLVMYLDYARKGVALQNMPGHWREHTRTNTRQIQNWFGSDNDADLLRTAQNTHSNDRHDDTEPEISGDSASTRNERDDHEDGQEDDHTTLMVCDTALTTRHRTPRSSRTEIVIFELHQKPHIATIDPDLTRREFRETIGALSDLHPPGRVWDNFEVHPVKPLPPDFDALTHFAFIFVHPNTLQQGFAFVLVQINVVQEQFTCGVLSICPTTYGRLMIPRPSSFLMVHISV